MTAGTVTFTEGGKTLGTAQLDATGHAVLTVPAGAAAGTRTVTAEYGGSGLLNPSTTSTPTQVVVRDAPVTAPTTTPATSPTTSPAATPAGTPAASGTSPAPTRTVSSSTSPTARSASTTSSRTAAGTGNGTGLAATGVAHVGGLTTLAGLMLVGGLALLLLAAAPRRHHGRHRS